MKICKKCGGTEFYKNNKCKSCKKIQDKIYRANNKKIESERKKKWRDKNIEKERNRQRLKYKQNPEPYIFARFKRRARMSIANGKPSKGIVNKLFNLQKGRCACCGDKLEDDFHVDHIIPISLGGDNNDNNLQLLKSKCNLEKHSKHPIDFMQSKGYLL